MYHYLVMKTVPLVYTILINAIYTLTQYTGAGRTVSRNTRRAASFMYLWHHNFEQFPFPLFSLGRKEEFLV